MDNQQNNTTLRPSQDFKVNEKVRYFSEHTPIEGVEGTIVAINVPRIYPIKVQADTGEYTTFTLEGRSRADGRVDLFRLEESDKSEQADTTADIAPSLQTFKHIAEWIAKTAQFVEGDWYVGKGFLLNTLTTDELYQLYVYKGLEEGQ